MPRQVLLRRFVLVFSLIFYLFLALSVPYSATDDWLWGMEEGLRWWLGGMLNGRYAGNFFAVVMCRFPAVKVLAMGLTMFLLPFLMALLAARGEERRFLPLFLACNAGIPPCGRKTTAGCPALATMWSPPCSFWRGCCFCAGRPTSGPIWSGGRFCCFSCLWPAGCLWKTSPPCFWGPP